MTHLFSNSKRMNFFYTACVNNKRIFAWKFHWFVSCFDEEKFCVFSSVIMLMKLFSRSFDYFPHRIKKSVVKMSREHQWRLCLISSQEKRNNYRFVTHWWRKTNENIGKRKYFILDLWKICLNKISRSIDCWRKKIPSMFLFNETDSNSFNRIFFFRWFSSMNSSDIFEYRLLIISQNFEGQSVDRLEKKLWCKWSIRYTLISKK